MTQREYAYHNQGKVIGRFKKRPQREEDLYDICHVCKGGSDSTGPYKCWYCEGEGVEPPKKDDDL